MNLVSHLLRNLRKLIMNRMLFGPGKTIFGFKSLFYNKHQRLEP